MNLLPKQTHSHRKQTYGYQRGKGHWGGKNQEIEINIYTLLYVKDDLQGPTVQHKNYIQYFTRTYKESESKECIMYTHTHIYTHIHMYMYN